MAAGDRKIRVMSIEIDRTSPVAYRAHWQLLIENKVGQDVFAMGGRHAGSFGLPAVWRALTGAQMEAQVTTDVAASLQTPPRDSIS